MSQNWPCPQQAGSQAVVLPPGPPGPATLSQHHSGRRKHLNPSLAASSRFSEMLGSWPLNCSSCLCFISHLPWYPPSSQVSLFHPWWRTSPWVSSCSVLHPSSLRDCLPLQGQVPANLDRSPDLWILVFSPFCFLVPSAHTAVWWLPMVIL